MMKKKHSLIAMTVVICFGFVLFFVGTDGFTAFTAETARVNQLIEEQPLFPEVVLEDSQGRIYPISELRGKNLFITFIYTACTTVCLELEQNMAEVYAQIPEQYIGEDVMFLSISFDPERDDPARLNMYKDYFNSDGETWRMARITDEAELNSLLEAFGVIVIPLDDGHFAHNSAFYVVDREGYLIDVMDYTKIDEAATQILHYLES